MKFLTYSLFIYRKRLKPFNKILKKIIDNNLSISCILNL